MTYGTLGLDKLISSTGQSLSPASSSATMKNRLINSGMVIAQRGTSFTSPASGSYTLDRWFVTWTGVAPATVAQVAGPAGFRNALQITGTTGNTATALAQRIESYNCSDLSGQTVTIQANMSASTPITVGWTLSYANATDNFGTVTSIASGTWSVTTTSTVFSATITGLPAGAVNGLQLTISPNNNTAFTSGATFYITGVQLEVGTVASSFDYRDYGRELAMCQRYLPAYNVLRGSSVQPMSTGAFALNSTSVLMLYKHPITTRVPPTGIQIFGLTGSNVNFFNGAVLSSPTSVLFQYGDVDSSTLEFSGLSSLATSSAGYFYSQSSSVYFYLTGCEL